MVTFGCGFLWLGNCSKRKTTSGGGLASDKPASNGTSYNSGDNTQQIVDTDNAFKAGVSIGVSVGASIWDEMNVSVNLTDADEVSGVSSGEDGILVQACPAEGAGHCAFTILNLFNNGGRSALNLSTFLSYSAGSETAQFLLYTSLLDPLSYNIPNQAEEEPPADADDWNIPEWSPDDNNNSDDGVSYTRGCPSSGATLAEYETPENQSPLWGADVTLAATIEGGSGFMNIEPASQ